MTDSTQPQPLTPEGPTPDEALFDAVGAMSYAVNNLPPSGGRVRQVDEQRLREAMRMLDAVVASRAARTADPGGLRHHIVQASIYLANGDAVAAHDELRAALASETTAP